jgi:hypothetical protein
VKEIVRIYATSLSRRQLPVTTGVEEPLGLRLENTSSQRAISPEGRSYVRAPSTVPVCVRDRRDKGPVRTNENSVHAAMRVAWRFDLRHEITSPKAIGYT